MFLIIITTAVALILLLLIWAFILPKHYSVTVTQTINKPKDVVFDYIRLFKHQTEYSEWLKKDPELHTNITGEDGVIGSMLRWVSFNEDKNLNVGIGEQEIINMDENQIEVELRLIKPLEGNCKLIHKFVSPTINQTSYTCTFKAYAKFPTNLPAYLIGRHFIKKTQQKTLFNVKAILESLHSIK